MRRLSCQRDNKVILNLLVNPINKILIDLGIFLEFLRELIWFNFFLINDVIGNPYLGVVNTLTRIVWIFLLFEEFKPDPKLNVFLFLS